MTTLKKPLLSVNGGHGSVELKIGQEFDDDNFEVLTDDISFTAKVRLLLWKNFMIQCRRRPKSCCVKCCIPLFIMFVLVTLTFISTLQPHLNEDAYGLEFDYIISNTGDSADFTLLYPMNHILPWPDSNTNANQWIKYIICDPNRVTNTNGRDINPPSYLAIIYPNYNTSTNFQKLLTILNKNYGTNNYLQEFEQNTIASNTWYTYEYFMNQSHISSTPFSTEPKSKQFVYVNCYNQSSDTTFVNFTAGSLLKFFNTEKELNDYITDAKYGNTGYNFNNTNSDATRPIGAAIVFNTIGDNNGMDWEYTFRFNSSVIPQTDTLIDKFTRNIDQLYYESAGKYLEFSGFIQLQNWLDQAIMEYMVNISNANMDTLNIMSKEYSKGLFMFPTKSYEESTYWNYIGQTFPFILFIMFCYPIITVLSILIEEKQSKIKEGMKMMGATTSTYWLSWFIFFFIEFTMIAVLVTLLGIGGHVFRYSDGIIIFLWFWLFCLSSATFAMMISTFFDNPKSGSLFGFIIYFAVLIGGQFSANLDENGKNGLCILAPACFVTSTTTLVQYEVSVIGLTFDNIHDKYNDFQFVNCLIMMAIDIIIYSILTLYLDQIWPSQYGQKQPFYFFILPSYWFPKCLNTEKDIQVENQVLIRRLSSINTIENYEKIGNLNGESVVNMRNLTKTFTSYSVTNGRREVKAVRGVSMDMYRGEVFCLLGHNGAGKTTTICMLTGLLDATHGSAYILQNDVTNPNTMSEIRKHLGVCPQHDVLWDRLSAREHLWLFARLKGVSENRVDKEVDQILENTGLSQDNNNDKFPPQMSGGQRRKLSLGIALIGGSQIVFLDEPTSGMDPQSRRITWDLINKEKKNRCIILTTHFMDEADILGDTIAIMNNGQIECCGSSLYLKQTYGVGYTFTVSLETNDDTIKDIDNIKRQIDKYVFDIILNSKSVSLAGSELTYRLPFEQTGSFSKLFDILDENKDLLYIKSYGISVTTLEEVFLKIGHDREEGDNVSDDDSKSDDDNLYKHDNIGMDAKNKLEAQNQFKQPTVSTFALKDQNSIEIFFIHIYAILYKRFWWSLRDFKALLCSLFCPVLLSGMALGLLTIQIATNQPYIELTTNNWYSNINDVNIPIANINNSIYPTNNSYTIPNNFYNDNNTFYNAFINYLQSDIGNINLINNTNINPNNIFEQNTTDYDDKKLENLFFQTIYNTSIGIYPSYYNITKSFQDWLLENEKEYYNAFLFMPYSMTQNRQKHVYFGVNGSALHSLPITLNIWNNWIIRDILSSSTPNIKINNHPLPVTTRQNLIGQQITGFATTTYLVIAFSFIPAGAIYFIVNEKAMNTKHQQLVSGISFTAYWTANFIADFIIGLPASLLVFASIFIFDTTTYEGEASIPFLLIMIIFLFSALPFTYLLSFLFSSPSKAQLTTILLFIITGIILATVAFILDLIDSTRDINDKLKGIYRIFPIYLMTESLFNVSEQSLLSESNKNFYAWDVCGRNYVLMTIEGFVYFGVVLFLEYLSSFPVLLSKLGFVTNRPLTEIDNDLDIDVLNEKQRIINGISNNNLEDTVIISGLRKVYDPAGTSRIFPCFSNVNDEDKIEAVKNLYFGVKQSEVFGYLGVNGAGKTTTLATLTGERYPSSGDAYIANFPISNQLQCRRYIGYCPQFDAIFDLLTAKEHLKFYAMIKGLKGNEANEQVKVLLNALTLNKYKNRVAGTYSGGNKRKLSVAVAMIGNPPVIFLDEPSTGMDPVSRRFMWEFISTTMSGRCVILTTHSMEECEALCNRVGIMVNGQLKCIGTAQHLKSRYGKGYQLDITLINNNDENELKENIINLEMELTNYFGQITLIEYNGNRISYELIKNNKNTQKLGKMFNILENIKVNKLNNVIQSYALSQTTLEQIFIRMAKQGQIDNQKAN